MTSGSARRASPAPDDAVTDGGASMCCGGATGWLDAAAAGSMARTLSALADPTRLQIVSIIANAPDREVCACDFVEPLGKSQPTISHHLKVLSEAGLVDGERRGRWIWYHLAGNSWSELLAQVDAVVDGAGQNTPA